MNQMHEKKQYHNDYMPLALTGGYGRMARLSDWEKGFDFKITNGPYCSIKDVPLMKANGVTELVFYGHTRDGFRIVFEISI